MEPIILASGSLQRQEYFRLLDLPFSIMPPVIDESYDENCEPHKVVEDIALRKVAKIVELLGDRTPPWICSADTIVCVDKKILGKPANREDARSMLNMLQGRDHEVITAVALSRGWDGHILCRSVSSAVSFAPLSEKEIEWYLDTGEWQGAAGAYKIQGLAGCYISCIKGSYSSIVGLPLHELYAMLRVSGYPYGDSTR
ncbi:MAG: Maf family protein [Spirochaetaceae bacterium]|nr:Maf family protein [Spirochaetaceae bacterium]